MLDLIIGNEDRLPCCHLGWRGNYANMLFLENMASANVSRMRESFDSAVRSRRTPRRVRALQKERRSSSVGRLSSLDRNAKYDTIGASYVIDSPMAAETIDKNCPDSPISKSDGFQIVIIDSGVPRRPPTGKRASDQAHYPKLVELLLNSVKFSSDLLHNSTGGRLGLPISEVAVSQMDSSLSDITTVVQEFPAGFRSSLGDMQNIYTFLLTLHQKLDNLLHTFFLSIINKSSTDFDREDTGISESSQPPGLGGNCVSSPISKEQSFGDSQTEVNDSDALKVVMKSSSLGLRETPESFSLVS